MMTAYDLAAHLGLVLLAFVMEILLTRSGKANGDKARLKAEIGVARKELKDIEPQKEYSKYIKKERVLNGLTKQLEQAKDDVSNLHVWGHRWGYIAPLVVR
jgi:hypothetical protein